MIDLREVAALPWEEDLLVTARLKGVVDVWSLARTAHCATFETVWGGGGWRGALVPGQRPVVVAGAWERHGVCGYDLSGQRLWQDRSRTAVQVVTALAGGRVAVTYNRNATRVLEAASGEEVRSLHGALQVFALRPDVSLAVGSNWCRLLDSSLDPLRSRIATSGRGGVVSAATDGEHFAVAEIGGPLRIINPDGRERSRVPVHFRHIVHDPVTATWVRIQEAFDGQTSLLRLTHDAEVQEQRPCEPLRGVTAMRGGRALILLTDDGVQVLDCSDWSVHEFEVT